MAEIPEGMPTPKTYKEWAVAKLCGLDFGPMPEGLEPKTPIEKYLDYMAANVEDEATGDSPRSAGK